MKDRPDGFLSDERIHHTEVFDYIRKLEEEKERAQFDALEAQAENAKLQQKVLQYSRERSDANRAELEAKQQVWVLEQENACPCRVRDAAILCVKWHMADDKWRTVIHSGTCAMP